MKNETHDNSLSVLIGFRYKKCVQNMMHMVTSSSADLMQNAEKVYYLGFLKLYYHACPHFIGILLDNVVS